MSDNATDAPKTPRGRPFTQGNAGGPGRPRKDARDYEALQLAHDDLVSRLDGWANLLTKVGVEGRDKRLGHKFYGADRVSIQTARELWIGDPEVARLIERPTDDETRRGFEVDVPGGDEDAARQIQDEWRRIGLIERVRQCRRYRRAFGGGALLLGLDDGVEDWRFEVVDERVRGLMFVRAIDCEQLTPLYYYGDPKKAKFGEVAIWRYTPRVSGSPVPGEEIVTGQVLDVHESRLVRFDGIRTSEEMTWYSQRAGWGDSYVTRTWGAIRDCAAAIDATGMLVQDFGQAVYKIKGLAQILAQDKSDTFKSRMQAINLAKSTLGMLFIDENEDYQRTATPVTGLAELLRIHMERVAASAEMPVTLYWGVSPGGLNATGDSDIRGYYDRIESGQINDLCPALERVTGYAARGLGITIPKGKRITVTPCSLWQETEKESAEARKLQSDIDHTYITDGVVSPDEVRDSRFAGGKFSYETSVEHEVDASQELPDPDDVDAMAGEGAAAKSGKNPDQPQGAGGKESIHPAPQPVDTSKRAPGGPAAAAPAMPQATEPAKTAFTGVQVTALIDVVKAAGAEEISRESAQAIIELAFPVDAAQALRILGPESFKPVKPEPPPGPFGAGPPGAPKPGSPAERSPEQTSSAKQSSPPTSPEK